MAQADPKSQTYMFACSIFLLSLFTAIILLISVKNLLCKKQLQIKDKKVMTIENPKVKPSAHLKIKKRPLTISYEPFLRYATIGCLVSYFITHITSLIHFMLHLTSPPRVLDRPHLIMNIVNIASWCIARILMNSVFVARLKYQFLDTMWTYPRYVFLILYCLLATLSLVTIAVVIAVSIHTQQHTLYFRHASNILTHTLGCVLIFDIIFYVSLMYLYQRRLVQLVRSYVDAFNAYKQNLTKRIVNQNTEVEVAQTCRTHTAISMSDLSASALDVCNMDTTTMHSILSDVSFAHQDFEDGLEIKDRSHKVTALNKHVKALHFTKLQLINSVTQCTILMSVSLASLCGVVLSGVVIGPIFFDDDTQIQEGYIGEFLQFVIVIDSFVNCLCLYLHFAFSIKSYKRLCVHRFCLHALCMSCFSKYINRSIHVGSIL